MTRILKYQFDRMKKMLLVWILAVIMIFMLAFMVMRVAPVIVLTVVRAINDSEVLKCVFDIEKDISSVTYQHIMMCAAAPVFSVMMYKAMSAVAGAFWSDESAGITACFFSMPVKRSTYLFGKILGVLVCYLLVMAAVYVPFQLVSLHGAAHKFFVDKALSEVGLIMRTFAVCSCTAFCTGVFAGVLMDESRGRWLIKNIYQGCVVLCLLPVILRVINVLVSGLGITLPFYEGLMKILTVVREFVPLYWVWPWAVLKGSGRDLAMVVFIVVSVVLLAAATAVFTRKRNMFR